MPSRRSEGLARLTDASLDHLLAKLAALRNRLDGAFSKETAADWNIYSSPSAGHCVPVTIIMFYEFAGVSCRARVRREQHWFSRIVDRGRLFDVDLTGDQYGLEAVRVALPDELYSGTVAMPRHEFGVPALCRARLLASRAGLEAIELEIRSKLEELARSRGCPTHLRR